MAKITMTSCIALEATIVVTILLFVPIVLSDDTVVIPPDKAQLESWFKENVGPLADRKATIDPLLATAEAGAKVIKVKADGSGDFKTVTEAINSIPIENLNRVIVSIGPGNYTEKVKIERVKPFVTLYGDPKDMPALIFNGDAFKFGTVDSATLIVESDYFSAVNVIFVNSSPRPDGKRPGAQAVALRISGEKASFYNCKLIGFQDTLCDDKGKHLFKDCYIEGTVDFIFGNGRSLYLNNELHVIPGDAIAMITAQARKGEGSDTGYSFVHCKITGTGKIALLGRAWMNYAKVIYSYTDMSDAIKPEGWSNNNNAANDKTVFFGEYKNKGVGATDNKTRVHYSKWLTDEEVKPYIKLGFIEASKWLLPPTTI